MEVSKAKILNLARQIYMDLLPEEVLKLMVDVEKEVEDTKIIDEVDTKDVLPDISVLDKSNSLRKDEVVMYKDKEGLLSNASDVEDSMFVLPKIVQN